MPIVAFIRNTILANKIFVIRTFVDNNAHTVLIVKRSTTNLTSFH